MKRLIACLLVVLTTAVNLMAEQLIVDQRGKKPEPLRVASSNFFEPGVTFYDGGFESLSLAISFEDSKVLAVVQEEAELEEGEILIFQDLNVNNDGATYSAFIDGPNAEFVTQGIDTIDTQTTLYRAPKAGTCGMIKIGWFPPYTGPVEEWKSERQMSFSIQWIGLLSDFKLNSIKSPSSSLDEWIKEKNMSENTPNSEIIWRLTNELECKAVDTYGQEIVLNCPYYSWEIDKEAGTATYTPYFTPRLYKTRWKSGEPFEMTFSANKSAGVGSDGDNYEYKDNKLVLRLWAANKGGVTGKFDKSDNHSLSVRADGRNLIVSTTSVYYVYDSSGRPVYHGSDSRVTVSAPGLYILRTADGLTEKVTVK